MKAYHFSRRLFIAAALFIVVPLLALSTLSIRAQSPAETPIPPIYPTIPPEPTVGFAGDKFTRVVISDAVVNSIGNTWLSFININDKPSVTTPGTPTAANQLETVYVVAQGGTAMKVLDLPSTTGQHVYWSPSGAYLAYFVPVGSGAGLYVLDLRVGVSVRLFELANLNPRGIASEPVWTPDSQQLTIALATDYDVDIFAINVDGNSSTNFRNLTQNRAFDFWPTWSPDGQFMAFVSDREVCPTWVPNEPQSCYRPDVSAPDGGNLYVLEIVSGAVRKVSDEWVTSPPHWISPSRLAFISGTRGDPTAGTALWWADLRGGPAHRVSDNKPGLLVTRDSWTPNGHLVVYQEAESTTNIVIRDETGREIARSTDLNFPRVAFTASWSPDGQRLVMGGRNAQCPYGMLLTDSSFNIIVNANANPGVCDPQWSPDGRNIAFSGVTQSGSGTDGRFDVYIAEATGFGARNLSFRFGGQIRMLGWINKR